MSPFLLPQLPNKRSIAARLNESIAEAQAFYGAVCFWCIGPDLLNKRLINLLGQPGSFCIVDIHTPTNVDKLTEFYNKGGTNFYIFAKEIQLKTGEYYLQRHLLHIKMLVFDLPHNQAEIWVGSHNFTKQALTGINREATMVFPCQQGDVMYLQARHYLETVLADPDCKPFNPALVDDYKKLQGIPEDETEPGCYVLPLAWDSARIPSLSFQTVTLVGDDPKEGRQLFQASGDTAPLAIRAYDLASNSIRHFTAIVQNQGAIDRAEPSSYDVAFGPRHLAVRPPGIMPYIAPLEEPLTSTTLLKFSFWATVRILDELPANLKWAPAQRTSNAGWEYEPETTSELETDQDSPVYYSEIAEPEYSAPSYLHDVIKAQATDYPNAGQSALDFTDTSPDTATLRVKSWLAWATRRTTRHKPLPPIGRHAVFSNERSERQSATELDSLDEAFGLNRRQQLLLGYAQPMRSQFYESNTPNQEFNTKSVPRLSYLIKRYRLVL